MTYNFELIISELTLEKSEQIENAKVFDTLFKDVPNGGEYYYANYLLLENLYYLHLQKLYELRDIDDTIYNSKNQEIDAFFTLWYRHKEKTYLNEQEYALVVSPRIIYTQSQFTLDGQLYTDNTLAVNLVSANLLRQTIELLLLDTCNYPINKNNRSPSFSQIIKALNDNKYEACFKISDDVKKFIPTSYSGLDILDTFYQYLSKLLHKNMSGYLFSWQLYFIQCVISNTFSQTFPKINIIKPELETNSTFYTVLKCTPGRNL